MNGRTSIWQRIVCAAIVAAGAGVAWGVAAGWIVSLAESFARRTAISEQLSVAYDGTPVISVQSDDLHGMRTLDRRTLDGKPWSRDYEWWLQGAYPRRHELPPGVVKFPVRWTEYGARIGGVSDGKKPPTAWYIVSSDERAEQHYFAGYDPLSRLSVGYIGTEGFRLTPPPRKEQFSMVGNEPGLAVSRVTSTQYIERYSIVRYHDLSAYDRPAQWLLFFVDGKRLWEVDLRERTARTVLEVDDAISLSMLSTLESTVLGERREDTARHARPSPFRFVAMQDVTGIFVPAAPNAFQANQEPPKTANILSVRTRDSMLLYHPVTGNHWQFKLPGEVPPDRTFSAYWLDTDSLLVNCQAGHWSGGSIQELYWISPDGAINQEERIELHGYVPPPERQTFWVLCALMPEPLGWLGALFGVDPLWRLQNYKADTYTAALRQTFDLAWPMAVIVLLMSIGAAWYTGRLHRRYFRQQPVVWTAFVLVFGLPGLIAYWLEHRRAKLEPCSECGARVPRDRDTCSICATPFTAPPLVGTEVFA